jgi:4-hydroxy-tetrahydrodipicolinate synthase
MFQGVFTAILTPFHYGEIDISAFEKMVDWQIASGVDGIVIAGSTGEGQSLSIEEITKLLEIATKKAKGKVKIIANASSNLTTTSIELARVAESFKVDAIMVVSPYYVKPTQEGIYQHLKAIHDATNLPIVFYNNPARCGVDASNETILRFANLPRAVAVKECSGNPVRTAQLLELAKKDFRVLCGDDILMLPCYTQGASGIISVVSNLVPSLMVKLHKSWKQDKIKDAMELQKILRPFIEAIFCEPNPVAVKYAASQFGICLPDLRLPLVPLAEKNKKYIQEQINILKEKLNG